MNGTQQKRRFWIAAGKHNLNVTARALPYPLAWDGIYANPIQAKATQTNESHAPAQDPTPSVSPHTWD